MILVIVLYDWNTYFSIVKKGLKKYLITGLSLLLILSNFSFATQLLFCSMNMDAKVCGCSHDNGKPIDGLSISKVKAKCCNDETTELSNTNSLLTFKTELPQEISVLGVLVIDKSSDSNSASKFSADSFFDKSHLPKLDIPILTSSLLI